MTFKENTKKLFIGEEWFKTLHAFQIPLNDMFESVREYPRDKYGSLDTRISHTGEYFVSLKTRDSNNKQDYHSFLVKPTKEFAQWLRANSFGSKYENEPLGISGFEIIQQSSDSFLIVAFLIVAEESQIIGDLWLDYKTKGEIFGFFK